MLLQDRNRRTLSLHERRRGYDRHWLSDLDWHGDLHGYLELLDGIGRDSHEGLLLLLLLDRPDCRYGGVCGVGVSRGGHEMYGGSAGE
jgi:hypothetical protein